MILLASVKIYLIYYQYYVPWGKAMANYPQELAQDAAYRSPDRALVPAQTNPRAEY
jgi:hypothetical protein